MKHNQEFKLWDTIEKIYFKQTYETVLDAEDAREMIFEKGFYPDRPITVVQVHQFIDGKFKAQA